MKPGWQPHDLTSHSVTLSQHWANQSLPYPNNDKHLARKQQVYIFISHWFDSTIGLNRRSPARRPMLYQFGHRAQCNGLQNYYWSLSCMERSTTRSRSRQGLISFYQDNMTNRHSIMVPKAQSPTDTAPQIRNIYLPNAVPIQIWPTKMLLGRKTQ